MDRAVQSYFFKKTKQVKNVLFDDYSFNALMSNPKRIIKIETKNNKYIINNK